jgi:hypothetical protein
MHLRESINSNVSTILCKVNTMAEQLPVFLWQVWMFEGEHTSGIYYVAERAACPILRASMQERNIHIRFLRARWTQYDGNKK